MKTHRLINSVVTAALVAGAISVINLQAAPGASLVERRHSMIRARLAEKLGLTEQQKGQIHTVLRAEKETLAELAVRRYEAKELLLAAIRGDDTTEADVRTAAAAVAEVDADLAVERQKLFRQIQPVLTEEQLETLQVIEDRLDSFIATAIERIGER